MPRGRGATVFWWSRAKGGKREKVAAVDYVDDVGQSHRLTFSTMGEARACADEKRAQLRRRTMGLEVAKARCDKTLAQLCRWWLDTCCRPRGRSREESRLRVQVELERDGMTQRKIGKLPAADVGSELLEEHFDQLQREGLSAASINKLRQTLRTVYNKARKRNVWRGPNPVLDTEPRPERAIEYRVLELPQLDPVLGQIEPEWRDLFATAMLLGLRKGELFGALKIDVNRSDLSIRVHRSHDADQTKTGESRCLPIPAALWPFIEHALDTLPGPHLFPDQQGQPHKPHIKLEQKLRTALVGAGIVEGYLHKCRRCASRGEKHHETHADAQRRRCPVCQMQLWPAPIKVKMKFHELRHSTSTLLAALGVPENVRADILGHRSRAMTRRYTHLTVEQMREGFRKLDATGLIQVAPGSEKQPAATTSNGATDAGLTPLKQ